MLTVTDRKGVAATRAYFSMEERAEGRDQSGLRFWGKLADTLGIAGKGLRSTFNALVGNRTPDGDKLTPRDGENRVIGKEVTICAAKGVSLAAEFAPEGHKIVSAFEDAVRESLLTVEPLAQARLHSGGQTINQNTNSLLFSRFLHYTNRNQEPLLHAHVLIHNATEHDGRRLALKSTEIHTAAAKLQRDFHTRFRKRIADLGYKTVDRGPVLWDIAGIPNSTIRKFSSRREEIEQLYSERERVSDKLRKHAGALTRKPKAEIIDLDKLRVQWRGKLTTKEKHIFKTLQVKPKVGRRMARKRQRVAQLLTMVHDRGMKSERHLER